MKEKLRDIRYIIIDVDGTMTDTGLFYDDNGNELKKFSTRDGEAIKLAKSIGLRIIVITGRRCEATSRRMKELNIDFCKQGVLNKYDFLEIYLTCEGIEKKEVAYIGDDINDLKAMTLAGFIGCPADSCQEVLLAADYTSKKEGGIGAVRDIIEYMLRQRDEWNIALKNVYDVDCCENR